MRKVLVVTSASGATILRMQWESGAARIDEADDLVRPDVEGWLDTGLVELVRDGDHLAQRVTYPRDAVFLDNVAANLRAEFGLDAVVSSEEARLTG